MNKIFHSLLYNSELKILGSVLLIGLIHGLIYVYLIPPWQHYDEPKHFEYVWLVAKRPGLPKLGDYDLKLNQDVVKSMIEHGFYRGTNVSIDPNQPNLNIPGYPQLNDKPFYYIIASFPLRYLPIQKIENQLYAARMISMIFYLVSILVAWGLIREITSPENPLRWMVPAMLALLPAFVDLMTAINNDSAAVAIYSVFLWISTRIIKRGLSFLSVLALIVSAILCYWTKNTVWIALPLLLIAILITFLKRLKKNLVIGLLTTAIIIGIPAVFNWGDAADWVRLTMQSNSTRTKVEQSPLGKYSLTINVPAGGEKQQLDQFLPPEVSRSIRGKKVTLGAWIWADKRIEINSPALVYYDGTYRYTKRISLDIQPAFFKIKTTIPSDAGRVWISLDPIITKPVSPTTIYYDGLVLAKGMFSPQSKPIFNDIQAGAGVWGGVSFTNLLDNASAEEPWPRVHPWVDTVGMKLIPDNGRPSVILYSLLDLKASGFYYERTVSNLLRTFWAKFGWAHVPLIGHKPYRLLGLVTLFGIVGAGWSLIRMRKEIAWYIVFWLGVSLAAVWGITLVRGTIYLIYRIFIPATRYAYPVIILSAIILNQGWLELIQPIIKILPKNLQSWSLKGVYCIFFLVLDFWSIWSIYKFYYHPG